MVPKEIVLNVPHRLYHKSEFRSGSGSPVWSQSWS